MRLGYTQYVALVGELSKSENNYQALRKAYSAHNANEEILRKDMRAHGPAADLITKMIHAYLGRTDIDIATVDEGYVLHRNGAAISGPLSEGEKTAIALCYFLSTIHAEGRKHKDLIVVIDDPISSLDTRALNYAFSIIKSSLGEAGQLFVLTHNINYMNEVKKWLKPKTAKRVKEGEEATAALFFLDTRKNPDGTLSTEICELPKHIREYDSEYHYLFNIVRRYIQSPNDVEGYLYVMPNAIRKVLDIFFAFKLPGNDGLGSKIENIAKSNIKGIDPLRLRSLERLVQIESHADNLEDLVSLSSMSIEEIQDAAHALVHLMETLDAEHYRRLCDVCT